jgi:GT2 family glycosyltransferase
MSTGPVAFSIVIPTYARPHRLAACLACVAELQFPRDNYEVIVVDDGSPEPLDSVVGPFRGAMRVSLLRQRNAGPAAARNAGAAQAAGEWLAFSDDDCEPDRRWLEVLADQMRRTPDALVGGRIVNRLPHNPFAAASQAITDCTYDRIERRGGETLFASCNLAVSAAQFRKLGGFDTSFPLAAGEDYDFCHRWRLARHPLVYAPEAIVNHRHDLTLVKFLRQHFAYGRGLLQFRRRASGGVVESVRQRRLANYIELLRWPLTRGKGLRAWRQSALIGLSQLATAAGVLREAAFGGTVHTARADSAPHPASPGVPGEEVATGGTR